MVRILMAVVGTALFAAFSLSNTQHVELSFIFGRPIEIRLIFLLGIAFGSGVVATLFQRLVAETRRRAEIRRLRLQLRGSIGREQEPE